MGCSRGYYGRVARDVSARSRSKAVTALASTSFPEGAPGDRQATAMLGHPNRMNDCVPESASTWRIEVC